MDIKSFCCEIRVYYEDTDAGGVVYYANYLKFLERARTEWLRKFGWEHSYFSKQNLIFVVSKINICYHKPAKLDDQLEVSCVLQKRKPCSLLYKQEIQRAAQLLVSAEVLIACVSSKNFAPQRIPEEIQKLF